MNIYEELSTWDPGFHLGLHPFGEIKVYATLLNLLLQIIGNRITNRYHHLTDAASGKG